MSFYEDRILPRIIDLTMRGGDFSRLRKACLANVRGTVLEIGFGSGLNLPWYTDQVQRLYALDPAELGRKLAQKRLARAPFPVQFIDLDEGARNLYPLADGSVDHAVSTWTLCTIPDPAEALYEIRRVLKPGGAFHFVEHGLAPDASVRKWQDRLNPIQNKIAGGCNLNRNFDEIIADAEFEFADLEHFYMSGPRVGTYIYKGIARASTIALEPKDRLNI